MVCPYALTRPGGVQGQVLALARALRAQGHPVRVIAPADDPAALAVLDPGAVGVGRPVGVRANGSVAPLALWPLAAHRARAAVLASGADVAHLHEPLAPLTGYGLLVAGGPPMVGTFHRSGFGRVDEVLAPLARLALRRLDARVAVSAAARDTAAALGGGEYEVLFNGVEVARFAAVDPWPTDRPTVLFLGRHEERKGLGVLLEAFEKVPDPARLWVAGTGPATSALRRRFPSSPRVEWLGALDHDEVPRRLAGADVLCAPSLFGESFGMVVVEAMAAGTPVVASDIPGYRDAAGGLALLVAPGDPAALADALTATLADARRGTGLSSPVRRAEAAARAASWSIEALAVAYLGVYRRVLSR